jgi:hypothetical protein
MLIVRKLVYSFIIFFLSLSPISAAAAAESTLAIAEEGWRHHGTLTVTLQHAGYEQTVDFLPEHASMAMMIEADADTGQYSSMLRFRPVFFDGSAITFGSSVSLKPVEDLRSPLPSYEVAFASGTFSRAAQDWIIKCRTPVDMEIGSSESPIIKRDIMTLRSANHSVVVGKNKEYRPNKYPIRFMQANYFDRGLLEQQLILRYSEIRNSILTGGNLELIVRPHLDVLRQIDARKQELDRIMQQMHAEMQTNDTATVMSHYSRVLAEESAPINTNECTNSYTCAEQSNLSYLYDHRVVTYLQNSLNVDRGDFVGLIVHAHCSHTPCHTCATSLTRERELGGIFSRIAKGRKVMVLCSCQEHYLRPKKMLPYEQTTANQHVETDRHHESTMLDFSIDAPLMPYPVVKLMYDAGTRIWSVDDMYLSRLQSQ